MPFESIHVYSYISVFVPIPKGFTLLNRDEQRSDTYITEGPFLRDFLEILKHLLQNLEEMFLMY